MEPQAETKESKVVDKVWVVHSEGKVLVGLCKGDLNETGYVDLYEAFELVSQRSMAADGSLQTRIFPTALVPWKTPVPWLIVRIGVIAESNDEELIGIFKTMTGRVNLLKGRLHIPGMP